ncbi:PA2169 family four-helix-bundle protein [Aliiglaciecola litoralis]|uniref:DUF2383 domain-containing protein n=1 Tax=Aliiglaciecola litoralis TaxID=582857 RepID=A0ABP3WT68_9ALTE
MTKPVRKVEKVTDIIRVLNGGIKFYEEAMEKVDSHGAKTVFGRMVSAKRSSVEKLQPFAIAENGEFEKDSDMAVDFRNAYTKVLSKLTSDNDHTYVEQLEEVEDKTRAVIHEALEIDQPKACKMALMNVLNTANETHSQMKSLQQTTS